MNAKWTIHGVLAIVSLASSISYAADVSFNFRVKSSGVRLYPCDAGLLDASGDSFIQASIDNGYSPDDATITFGNVYSLANRSLHTNSPSYFFRTLAYPTGYNETDTLAAKFQTILKDAGETAEGELTFNLSSTKYGAKYFVDFCYVGTQIDTPSLGSGSMPYSYIINDSVTAYDLTAGAYIEDSALKVNGMWICEDVGTGNVKFPATGIKDSFSSLNGFYLGSGMGMSISHGALGDVPGGAAPGTSVPVFNGDYITLANKVNKCVLRYNFEETASAVQRKWNLLEAKFVIDLHIKPVDL